MDVRYINPFMNAIKHVFTTMLSMEVEFGRPHVRKEAETTHDVSGIIGLSGDVNGVVIISLPSRAAVRIARAFAGDDLSVADDDFADAIGELANMISGNAKKDLDGMQIFISPPSVVVGSGHQVKSLRVAPRLVIPCNTAAGPFVVEVGMETVKPPKHEKDQLVGSATETGL